MTPSPHSNIAPGGDLKFRGHTGQQIEEELEEEAATNDDIDEMF